MKRIGRLGVAFVAVGAASAAWTVALALWMVNEALKDEKSSATGQVAEL